MAWIYDVRKKIFERNRTPTLNAMYAGAEGYKNDPSKECLINRGPLPRGRYKISRPIARHPTAGSFVLRLTPYADNVMCGRSGFLIHGDNGRGTASNGCIVATFDVRQKIANSGDTELIVQ